MPGAWAACVLFGLFFALMTPPGEGFDEPWHLAYIQHIAQEGAPPGPSSHISTEMEEFLRAHPIPRSLHTLYPELVSHDEYWRQPEEARLASDARLIGMEFGSRYVEADSRISAQYEAHQAPLYYYISAPVFRFASAFLSFTDTLLVIRIWSVVLASLVIPATFMLAAEVLEGPRMQMGALSLVVAFPGLYSGIVRVSNDALVAPVAAFFFVFLVRFLKEPNRFHFWVLAGLMVAGLWTKAFFIPIAGGAILASLVYKQRRAAAALMAVAILGAPWYARNLLETGSVTGLPETVSASTSVLSSIRTMGDLDWINLFNVARFSHIWIGNSSLLGVRAWMYTVIFGVFVLGLAGLLRNPRALLQPRLSPIIITYVAFVAGLVYYATQVFQSTGTSVVQGWYLTALIPIEAVLFAAGAAGWPSNQWKWLVGVLAVFLVSLLVYGAAFVSLPYYAGLISHNPSGHLATFHPQWLDYAVISSRLLRSYSGIPRALPWLALLTATALTFRLIGGAVRAESKR